MKNMYDYRLPPLKITELSAIFSRVNALLITNGLKVKVNKGNKSVLWGYEEK
jgi:hypothetical protein